MKGERGTDAGAGERSEAPADRPRPRLLAVSGVAPWPPRHGFAVRAAHLLEGLAANWDISLVTAEAMDPTLAPWPSSGPHAIVTVPLATPWLSVPGRNPELRRLRQAVDGLIATRRPDAALLFNGAEFLAFGRPDFPPAVADRIDCGALERFRFMRRLRALKPFKSGFQALREGLYERRVARSIAAVTVVGADDAAALRWISGREIHVIENGVHAAPTPAVADECGQPTVMFSGSLSYYANVDAVEHFARELWPRIHAEMPEARFVVVGRGPHKKVLALADLAGIEIRADVPDMAVALRDGWVSIAPLRCGVGVKNKVLEAWAVARPVVLTPIAANGIRLDATAAELVAADPATFGDLVLRLLRDRDLRRAYGAAAHRLVLERHRWRDSADRMSDLLQHVTSRASVRTRA